MTDPRKGLPSSSNAEADTLCAGRHNAQKGLPELPSDDADFGTLVHEAFTSEEARKRLSPEQEEVFEAAKEVENRIVDQWLAGQTLAGTQIHRHRRYWLTDPATLMPLKSGEVDAAWVYSNHALIEDLKSLWGDITEAPSNLQLRELAVLVWMSHQVDSVTVFINQPRATRNPLLVEYTTPDLERSLAEMIERAKRSITGTQRIPGDKQCRRCRARAYCREAIAWSQVEVYDAPKLTEKTAPQWVATVSPKTLATIVRKSATFNAIVDAAKQRLKAMPADQLAELGAELVPGRVMKPIKDVFGLAERLGDKVTREEFLGVIEVKKGDLEKLYKPRTGLKGKTWEAHWDGILDGLTEEKPTEPVLKWRKG